MKKKIVISATIGIVVAVFAWAQARNPMEHGSRDSAQLENPRSTSQQPRVIRLLAHRFEFVPNKIVLKKGEPVVLEVTSEDVTHGFFSRPLRIDEELEIGETRSIPLTPRSVGTFSIICDHFCGVNHGAMQMTIEVVE